MLFCMDKYENFVVKFVDENYNFGVKFVEYCHAKMRGKFFFIFSSMQLQKYLTFCINFCLICIANQCDSVRVNMIYIIIVSLFAGLPYVLNVKFRLSCNSSLPWQSVPSSIENWLVFQIFDVLFICYSVVKLIEVYISFQNCSKKTSCSMRQYRRLFKKYLLGRLIYFFSIPFNFHSIGWKKF